MLTDTSRMVLIYRGESMGPTLQEGDVVSLSTVGNRAVRRGDIIVFPAPGEARRVIHRVVAVTPAGYLTRGDNAPSLDPWTVKTADIYGLVRHIYRSGKLRRLAGGFWGHSYACARRAVNRLASRAASCVRPLYHGLSRNRLVRHAFTSNHRLKILSIARPAGMEWKLFLGKREIGSLPAGHEQWRIKSPYLLLVDESSLPRRGEAESSTLRPL